SAPEPQADQTDEPAPAGALDAAGVRRVWPDVLEAVKGRRRFTWMMLLDNVQVVAVEGTTLTLAFGADGPRKAFASSGSDEVLRQGLIDVLGVDIRIETILDPSRTPGRDAGAYRGTSSPPGEAEAGRSAPAGGGRSRSGPADADPPQAEASAAGSGTSRGGHPGASQVSGFAPGDGPVDDAEGAPPVDLRGRDLVARELGAQVIDEYDDR
ncbi:MAG: DNA polymerase III subunit gamma and tau, partial [Actinomycetes bacterium]